MKKIFTYLVFFFFGLLLFSCDKPAPTELVEDSVDEFEALNKDYVSGADTSGITQDITRLDNLISVSGIKITKGNTTLDISLAQAIFFDKTKPIKVGGRLLAYRTVTPFLGSNVKFDGYGSHVVPYVLKYFKNGIQDTITIGNKYVLFRINGLGDQFIYYYGSNVRFEIDPIIGQLVSFDIQTPPEINGNVHLSGSKSSGNLETVLNWNSRGDRRISIIIGIMKDDTSKAISIYRIRTTDDGIMRIPQWLLKGLPLSEIKNFVFTFVRSYEEETNGNGNNKLYLSSQSIHSIIIDIP